MNTKLYRIILPVKNINEAEQFYSAVLKQKGSRVSEGRHYFNLGGTILACYDPVADGDELGREWKYHENQYIYIAVDDLESVYTDVKNAGGKMEGPIEEMPWGERLFYCQDPFGTPICFVDENTVFLG